MVGRVGFEPTTIGLKVQNGEIQRSIYQCVTGASDVPRCTTVYNNAALIHAKLTQKRSFKCSFLNFTLVAIPTFAYHRIAPDLYTTIETVFFSSWDS